MATKADSSSASAPKLNLSLDSEDISSLIAKLKEQVISDRSHFVKDKIEENGKKLFLSTNNNMSTPKSSLTSSDNTLLTERKANSLSLQNGSELHSGEKDNETYADEVSNAMISAKSPSKLIKLPEVLKLPPYTTWIFLDRNQRMPEDQSIVGRRRIYYDQSCGEALICSDSEEEVIEDEEEKKEFGTGEDFIIWNTIQETGISDAVLEFLGHYFGRKPLEIQERYDSLQRIKEMEQSNKSGGSKEGPIVEDPILEKDLESALDSFDNLFCRRCLVFDCRLHGCSQDLVFPTEKQAPWSLRDEGVACSNQCFLLAGAASSLVPSVSERPTLSSMSGGIQLNSERTSTLSSGRKAKSHQSENISSNANLASDSSESEVSPRQVCLSPVRSTSPSKVKPSIHTRNRKRVAEKALTSMKKKQKKLNKDTSSSSMCKLSQTSKTRKSRKESTTVGSQKPDAVEGNNAGFSETDAADCSKKEEFVDENTCKPETDDVLSWKDIEKSLFTKGVEIFGKNSCLIARNLLNGMKTCAEVFQYICFIDNKSAYRSGEGMDSRADGCKGADYNGSMGTEFRRRSRFLRRRGRVRRLKYTWKQSGYHSTRKRISERKDQPCRQYNPCGCQTACGKQCPCLVNGTCCEKYCGCPKICKNRFRGCHCAKSQCRSRQCPCFAANRECDPDVCRNCWVGCGDGSLGGPTQRGDNYECRNMKLLLKQQQRVLLGRSDVSGWGAFLKNSVNKHEYLGEYTGELISHREADKRGKIYDRENSSFLFNLNDQFVLDAYRKGDKLKFANHSPDPNCYAKVIMVAGDHRVGIFAKERINAGEELFYDYRYEPDRAPAWARKPETSTMKKDEPHSSTGRAKKLA